MSRRSSLHLVDCGAHEEKTLYMKYEWGEKESCRRCSVIALCGSSKNKRRADDSTNERVYHGGSCRCKSHLPPPKLTFTAGQWACAGQNKRKTNKFPLLPSI